MRFLFNQEIWNQCFAEAMREQGKDRPTTLTFKLAEELYNAREPAPGAPCRHRFFRMSPFSGKLNSMDLPVTKEQLDRWYSGEMIQNVMPNLTADEREFLMTGITPEEWEDTFGVDNEYIDEE